MGSKKNGLAISLLLSIAISALLFVQNSNDNGVASGSRVDMLVQGGYTGWLELSYDEEWYEYTAMDVIIQNSDPMNDEPPYGDRARFVLHRGQDVCDNYNCSSWPSGTTTDSTTVDGLSATKYTLPQSGTSGTVLYGIDHPTGELYVEIVVTHAADQSSYDDFMDELELIVASIDFVTDFVDVSGWTEYSSSPTSVSAVAWCTLLHPQNWQVSQTTSQIVVGAPVNTVDVVVTFTPSMAWSAWDAATLIPGSVDVRFISSSASNGMRTTVYMMANSNLPIRVTAVMPDSTPGTNTYWTDLQTIWAIMSHTGFEYDADPYP